MLGAVIFDFDGVIADSEMLHFSAFNQVLRQFGVEIKKDDYFKNYLGLTDVDLFGDLIDSGKLKVDADKIEDLFKQKTEIFQKLAESDCQIMDGVPELLSILKDANIPMAICSGAILSDIELILEGAGLRSFFDVIVSAEQVEKGKPAPDGFLLALEKLNESNQNPVSPGDCIVIEDSHWGLVAAKAAGMHTVAVTNSYAAEQLKPAEKIVTRLGELTIDDLQNLCG